LEIMMTPVTEERGRGRRYAPISGVGNIPPRRQIRSNFVDDWCRVVFLLDRREAFRIREYEAKLVSTRFLLLLARFGNRREKF
jgi:hypothetical protein